MLRLLEDKLEVVDSMKMQPLPACSLPSVPKFEHAKPQSPGECTGATLIEPESFMALNIKDRGDAKACAGGHSPDASIPAFGKLKMLMSEACHKNYVIFDHSKGKNTVILHPTWLNSPPYYSSPQPCFAREAKYFVDGLQAYNYKSFEALCSSAGLSTVGLEVPVYSETFAMQVQQKMASSKEARCSLIDFMNSGPAQNLKKDIRKESFLSDIEEESHDEFHENTEEIDALLSSDDELSSTGHSPSDASSNCLSEPKNGHVSKVIGKKRKLGYSALDEVDDADSGPGKLKPADHTFLNSERSGSFFSLHFLSESDHKDTFSGVDLGKVSDRVEKSSTVDDVSAEKSECKSKQSSGTFGRGPVDSSKRIRLKNNVQQLRNVVPDGDCLDTAGVLGRTIHYVKCLQSRLRDLEAA